MNACAWVPFTGIPHNLPAKTLLVPSNPKDNEISEIYSLKTCNYNAMKTMKITEAFIEAEKVNKTYSEQSLITPQHNSTDHY